MSDLLKLSREKLKQLCKDRGHTGYSKCTKPQLVALLQLDTPSKFNSSMMTTTRLPEQDASSSTSVPKKPLELGVSGLEVPITKKRKYPNQIPSKPSLFMKPSAPSVPSQAKQKPPFSQRPSIPRELFVPPTPTTPATAPHLGRPPILSPPSRLPPPPPELMNSSPRSSGRNTRPQSSKYVDPRKTVPSNYLVPQGPQKTLHSISVCSSSIASVEPLPPPYLGFSDIPVPVLGPIGMPPSISDRKRVGSWSIILSGVSNAERRTCVLVSRMFRYAGKSMFRLLYLGYLICALQQSICPLQ